jgi:hypothetical protein
MAKNNDKSQMVRGAEPARQDGFSTSARHIRGGIKRYRGSGVASGPGERS